LATNAARAPCPGCGAPVEFRSAQSTHAVCSFCRSTVVRDGDTLARIGKMAELFDDHSPLQLMARAAGRAATSRWSAGCSTAAPAAPGPNGTRCSTTAAPAPGWRGQRRLRVRAAGAAQRELPQAEQLPRRRHHRHQRQVLPGHLQRAGGAGLGAGRAAQAAAAGTPFAMVELRSAEGEVLASTTAARRRPVARPPVRWRNCSSPACAKTAPRTSRAASSPARTAARPSGAAWPTARASPAAPATA
jgi:hypothetical protein